MQPCMANSFTMPQLPDHKYPMHYSDYENFSQVHTKQDLKD